MNHAAACFARLEIRAAAGFIKEPDNLFLELFSGFFWGANMEKVLSLHGVRLQAKKEQARNKKSNIDKGVKSPTLSPRTKREVS